MFKNIPPITKNLLIINLIIFMAQLVGEQRGFDLTRYFGLHFILADHFMPHQLVSYLFLHASFSHLFFNMFALWMFGCTLERVFGPRRFLLFYMVCGLGAGLVQEVVQYLEYVFVFSNYDSVNTGVAIIPMSEYLNLMTTVGASGAIYGILLGFGLLFPNQPMFIFPLPMPIKAKWFVIGYVVIELLLGLQGSDGVAHFAHLGGMLFGFLLIVYWRKKYRNGQYRY